MDSHTELKILIRAIQEGVLLPHQLPLIGALWLDSGSVPLVQFLVEQGYLSRDQIKKLETAINVLNEPSPELEQTIVAPGGGQPPSTSPKSESGTHSHAVTPSTVGPEKGSGFAETALPDSDRYSQFRSFRKGGPGQIWLAWDDALGRDVIVKSLRPDLAKKPAMLARFIREARITGQLEHPNIIPIYDVMGNGKDSGNWAYSMRYVSGPTLAEAIEKYHARRARGEATHLDLVSLLDSFVLLCRAVAFAHSRNVIHRDLKGQNVVLGDFGEVILLDWGLGKSTGETDPDETVDFSALKALDQQELTAPGSINGTPAYMSPEVASGQPATKSSDIYSLGAILYAILTGRPPYRGANALETLELVKKGPPATPSEIHAGTPRALEAITNKAMNRQSDQRYSGADTLAEDVRRWLVDEPVSVYPDPPTVRLMRWARKHRTAVVASTAFLATAVIALAASTVLVWNEQRETLKQKMAAEENYKLARDLSQSSMDLMDKSEVYFAANEELSQSRKIILDNTAKAFRKFHQQEPGNQDLTKTTMKVFRFTGNVHRLDGELDLAQSLFEEALAMAGQSEGDWDYLYEKANVLRDFAKVKDFAGKPTEARKTLEECQNLFAKLDAAKPGDLDLLRVAGIASLDLAGVQMEVGETRNTEDLLKRSITSFSKLTDKENRINRHPYDIIFLGNAYSRMGVLKRGSKQYPEAMDFHAKAMDSTRDLVLKASTKQDLIVEGITLTDLLMLSALWRLERTLTWVEAGSKKPDEIKIQWGGTIDQLVGIAIAYPDRPMYGFQLVKAYYLRGNWRESIGDKAGALQDFRLAKSTGDKFKTKIEQSARYYLYYCKAASKVLDADHPKGKEEFKNQAQKIFQKLKIDNKQFDEIFN